MSRHFDNKDLGFLNITIERYDLDRIQENANSYIQVNRDWSPGMAWASALLDYLYKRELLDRSKVLTFSEEQLMKQKRS